MESGHSLHTLIKHMKLIDPLCDVAPKLVQVCSVVFGVSKERLTVNPIDNTALSSGSTRQANAREV